MISRMDRETQKLNYTSLPYAEYGYIILLSQEWRMENEKQREKEKERKRKINWLRFTITRLDWAQASPVSARLYTSTE